MTGDHSEHYRDKGTRGARSPSCSIVVSTRDRLGPLAVCLHSVRDQAPLGYEVIVADSAPRRESAESVADRFGARYLRVERPGLSRARNRGAHAASGEVVVFLDDDVTLDNGCIASLLEEFADPRTAAVGGRIVLGEGDPAAREAFESYGGFDPGPERRVIDRQTPDWFELTNFGGLGSGAMLAIRRAAFDSWPGFDERLGRGAPLDAGEEMHAYFSLVERGYRAVYTPRAVARHPAPASMAELRERVLGSAAISAAYLVMLYVEYPEHRAAVSRYARQALVGQRREWRPRPTAGQYAIVPPWRVRASWCLGPLLYLRMRRRTAAVG